MISIAERHKYIKEQLQAKGFVRVNDLADQLGVTGATIRKDLRILESQNILLRTHGSASPVKPHVMDISIDVKAQQNKDKKPRPLILKDDQPRLFQKALQSNAISGAAKLEHQRIPLLKRGAPNKLTSVDKARYRPIKIGI